MKHHTWKQHCTNITFSTIIQYWRLHYSSTLRQCWTSHNLLMLKHNTWNRHCGDISCATIIQYWVSRLWQCYSHNDTLKDTISFIAKRKNIKIMQRDKCYLPVTCLMDKLLFFWRSIISWFSRKLISFIQV